MRKYCVPIWMTSGSRLKIRINDGAKIPMNIALATMKPGDGVLYQGTHHRHGRTTPNPNGWSAHLFLHWVDRDGPYATFAHDSRPVPPPVNFSFA